MLVDKVGIIHKDTKEKSEVAIVDILSQLRESVNHSWSEFL